MADSETEHDVRFKVVKAMEDWDEWVSDGEEHWHYFCRFGNDKGNVRVPVKGLQKGDSFVADLNSWEYKGKKYYRAADVKTDGEERPRRDERKEQPRQEERTGAATFAGTKEKPRQEERPKRPQPTLAQLQDATVDTLKWAMKVARRVWGGPDEDVAPQDEGDKVVFTKIFASACYAAGDLGIRDRMLERVMIEAKEATEAKREHAQDDAGPREEREEPRGREGRREYREDRKALEDRDGRPYDTETPF